MLEAHVQVYQAIKKSYHDMNLASHQIPSPKIGFLKNIHQIDPAHETWLQYLASPFTRLFVSVPDMIQNGAIYIFFTTGTFQVHIPFAASIKHYNSYAPQSLDFIGLNYYANRHMVLMHSIKPTDANTCSDNEWYYRYPHHRNF
jgi:beta-glucosidase/6-phospho-beta-glucosidase/beta-galactosidase